MKSKGVTLNPNKCIFDAEEAHFVGLVFTKDGTKTDAINVKNLQEVTPPSNKAELRSFLGMVGYSKRFIPKFGSIVQPLRKLLKEKSWYWDEACQAEFKQLKSSLSEYSLLYHYVIGQDTELVVDPSETGLGAVVVQQASKTEPFRTVMYKSHSLKDEETQYSVTEREVLAIRWTVKKL